MLMPPLQLQHGSYLRTIENQTCILGRFRALNMGGQPVRCELQTMERQVLAVPTATPASSRSRW
jgi:hypothetical protein